MSSNSIPLAITNAHLSGTAESAGRKERPPHSGLAFLSIVALLCFALEIELLQQIDSLRLYLTLREITLEAAVALLFSVAIAVLWWLFALLVGRAIVFIPQLRKFRIKVYWSLWIAGPLAYLLLDVFQDFKLEFLPRWHAGTTIQMLAALMLTGICIAGFSFVDCSTLQRFCRTRLLPIAWLHIVLAGVAAATLWLHGVRWFHDYEVPSQATAISGLPDIYLITIDTLREPLSNYHF